MKVCWNIVICVWIGVIHGAVNVNGTFSLTSSPLTATDGELFTLTCSTRDGSAANIVNHSLAYGHDFISRINVSCNTTIHSISFIFNSTTDQGAWQCGKVVTDTDIHTRSNTLTIGPVMSTQSISTTTRYMDQETVKTTDGTAGHGHTSSSVMSKQSSSTTRNMKMTSDQQRVTTKDASTGEKVPNLLYIAVGAVGGTVLFTIVVVGVVCIRRRRKAAHQQNDMKEERNNKASPVYENTTDNNTVENDLYEGSCDGQPMNAAENQEDDFMLSDAYEGDDMPVTNTCTPREEVPSGDVNLENLYAKPDKSKHTEVQHVSDIYSVVQKPKKKPEKD